MGVALFYAKGNLLRGIFKNRFKWDWIILYIENDCCFLTKFLKYIGGYVNHVRRNEE